MIPATMTTQHPDNATSPEWCKGDVIEGEAELDEALMAYRDLGCHEVMWDSEGKDVDTHVVRKLLSKYPEYFSRSVMGRDVRLTYRIPNPRIEVAERKLVTETLQTIPLSSDVASVFYKEKVEPIFEVILPFATSGRELVWLHEYYGRAIAGTEKLALGDSMDVQGWVGSFTPKKIRVIPLVEDMDSLLSIDKIVLDFLRAVKVDHLRVFIARSDPALNYGLMPAVLLAKLALSKLAAVEESEGVSMHPILGVGSMPFRGRLSPDGVDGFLREYAGLATATVQSAFRYDYPAEKVERAVKTLNEGLPNGEPRRIEKHEEDVVRSVLSKCVSRYQERVEKLAPLVNRVASYVPRRRARKLHIGLFGYSRSVKGVTMPRAIPFAAALYSIGIPPEFVGMEALRSLEESEWEALRANYLNLEEDLRLVGRYVSWENINLLMTEYRAVSKGVGMESDVLKEALGGLMSDLSAVEEELRIKLGPSDREAKRYENFVNNFLMSFVDDDEDEARAAFNEAASLRRCIG